MEVSSALVVLRLQHASESPAGHIKTQIIGYCPKVWDSVGLGWVLIICTSNEFLGNVDTNGLAGRLGEQLLLD